MDNLLPIDYQNQRIQDFKQRKNELLMKQLEEEQRKDALINNISSNNMLGQNMTADQNRATAEGVGFGNLATALHESLGVASGMGPQVAAPIAKMAQNQQKMFGNNSGASSNPLLQMLLLKDTLGEKDQTARSLQSLEDRFGQTLDKYSQQRLLDEQKAEERAAKKQLLIDQMKGKKEIEGIKLKGKKELQSNKQMTQKQQKPPSQAEFKNADFALRSMEGERIFRQLLSEGYDPTDRIEHGRTYLPKEMWSDKMQRMFQAAENFAYAIVRPETGAAIGKDEVMNTMRTYFPQAGDTPEVLKQKEEARMSKIASARASAGPAFDKVVEQKRQYQPDYVIPDFTNPESIKSAPGADIKINQTLAPNEVQRLDTKTGKTAIFDKNTKKFVRWE